MLFSLMAIGLSSSLNEESIHVGHGTLCLILRLFQAGADADEEIFAGRSGGRKVVARQRWRSRHLTDATINRHPWSRKLDVSFELRHQSHGELEQQINGCLLFFPNVLHPWLFCRQLILRGGGGLRAHVAASSFPLTEPFSTQSSKLCHLASGGISARRVTHPCRNR